MMNGECNQLLQQVYETGFALDEANLYLDSHPCDKEALNYYHYVARLYHEAMAAYEAQCGPLQATNVTSVDYWNWIDDKWPWEGGNA